jgi:hypothetical protein
VLRTATRARRRPGDGLDLELDRTLYIPRQYRAALIRIRVPRRAQHLRQLCDIGRDPAGLVLREPLHRHAPAGLVLEIDVGQRLASGVDREAFVCSSTRHGGGKRRAVICRLVSLRTPDALRLAGDAHPGPRVPGGSPPREGRGRDHIRHSASWRAPRLRPPLSGWPTRAAAR